MTNDDEAEKCAIARESAMEKAMDYCSPEAMRQATRARFGLDPDGESECQKTLVMGIDADSSPREVREWVHCRANKLANEEDMGFADATQRAWSEADEHQQADEDDDLPPFEELFGDDEDEDDSGEVELRDPDLDLDDTEITL